MSESGLDSAVNRKGSVSTKTIAAAGESKMALKNAINATVDNDETPQRPPKMIETIVATSTATKKVKQKAAIPRRGVPILGNIMLARRWL
jgi:hypothetical protein